MLDTIAENQPDRRPAILVCVYESADPLWTAIDEEAASWTPPGTRLRPVGPGDPAALDFRRVALTAEEPVGLYFERSAGFVIGSLGILRAGAAYVPLDPSHPLDRIRDVCRDAGVRVVLTDKRHAERLSLSASRSLEMPKSSTLTKSSSFFRFTSMTLAGLRSR